MRPARPLLLLLAACGAEPLAHDTAAAAPVGACAGEGAGHLELGAGGRSAFEPWDDGDVVALVEDPNTGWGLRVEFLTTGLDATRDATSVVRVAWQPGAPTDDYVAQVRLQCDDDAGVAWIGAQAPVPEAWQADPSALDGVTIAVEAVVTDASGEAATDAVELLLTSG